MSLAAPSSALSAPALLLRGGASGNSSVREKRTTTPTTSPFSSSTPTSSSPFSSSYKQSEPSNDGLGRKSLSGRSPQQPAFLSEKKENESPDNIGRLYSSPNRAKSSILTDRQDNVANRKSPSPSFKSQPDDKRSSSLASDDNTRASAGYAAKSAKSHKNMNTHHMTSQDRSATAEPRINTQIVPRTGAQFSSGSVNRDDESARSAMAFPVARRSDAESDRAVVAAKNGLNESKHFLSLQLFSTHAEPPVHEFLSEEGQLALELAQREEEDRLYRTFLDERRNREAEVAAMEDETEREELFAQMNRMERSRVINLAEKHCTQMMDLIHREKIEYLKQCDENHAEIEANYPRDPPPIAPPQFNKQQVYENNDAVFEYVDEISKAAASNQQTFGSFTAVVRQLVGRLSSELDKARAIFRLITETKFEHRSWFLYYPEEGNTRGAPTNLFRGVEFGIETKALLFKRLCAFAGLHSIVIKGYSKVKDYMPGQKFVDNRWRNAWNAVYVAGGWRLVQPNWASLQVNTKARKETRQIYQDHYFLTNPDEFIFEFFPMQPEHQFMEQPITKEDFENLPVLRSTFFHYGLSLSRTESLLNAVLKADANSEANIYLKSKRNISFHYSLKVASTGSTSATIDRKKKIPLDRFVMLSIVDSEATFNVHVPNKEEYILEIGCAPYPTADQYLAGPIPYINVCKFKIVGTVDNKVMVPLPDCVAGEWGPHKALSIFGLKGTSHPLPIIYAAPPSSVDLSAEVRSLTLNIELEKTQPVLDFVTKLYKNGADAKELKQGARYRNKENYVIFDIKVPQEGQYGLDIYARRTFEEKMLHCCKYLINCDV